MLAIIALAGCERQEQAPTKTDPSAAAEQVAIPLPSTPSPAALAWQASYGAEAAGKFKDALDALTKVPAVEQTGYLLNFRRAWLFYRMGRHAESVAEYNKAALAEPAAIEARIAMMLPLMALAKWEEIVTVSQEVLKRDPENYLTLQRLAFAKFSMKQYSEAYVLYQRLVQHYPADLDLRASLGWTLLRMGKRQEARALFKQVLEISAAHAMASSGYREAARN
jgi:tetratricopeptide (TPR) repeat protein